MKRIDYVYPRSAVIGSAVLFAYYLLLYTTKELSGRWIWLLYVSAVALVASVVYAIVAVAVNAARDLDGDA